MKQKWVPSLIWAIVTTVLGVLGELFIPVIQFEEVAWIGICTFAIFWEHSQAIYQAKLDLWEATNNNFHLSEPVRLAAQDMAKSRTQVERRFQLAQIVFLIPAIRGLFLIPSSDRRLGSLIAIVFLVMGNFLIVSASRKLNEARQRIRSRRIR